MDPVKEVSLESRCQYKYLFNYSGVAAKYSLCLMTQLMTSPAPRVLPDVGVQEDHRGVPQEKGRKEELRWVGYIITFTRCNYYHPIVLLYSHRNQFTT